MRADVLVGLQGCPDGQEEGEREDDSRQGTDSSGVEPAEAMALMRASIDVLPPAKLQ